MDLSKEIAAVEAELVAKHGEGVRARLRRGLEQTAKLWRTSDGDFAAFAREYFIADEATRSATFDRLQKSFEQMDGHLLEIGRFLRQPTDLDSGPLLPVDPMLAAFDPGAHVTDDLFRQKVGFVVLLNYPLTTLKERLENGKSYSRQQWAEARLAGRFGARVPGEIRAEVAEVAAAADLYIAEYNVWMHHVVNEKGERLFPKGLRLITHWNLRDELKANYADPKGLEKQRAIIQVMSRIVTQTIPKAVIDDPRYDWNPVTNTVVAAPTDTIEENAPKKGAVTPSNDPEPDTRYAKMLAHQHAAKKVDVHVPIAPTQIARAFELQREIPEERVEGMFKELLESPMVAEIAKIIEARLGRKLEPQDLWYNGFQARGKFSEADLDAITKKKYPTKDAFAADIPRILQDLGFSAERAKYLSERIIVDASRGAGHALQAGRRGDFPHLRTRVEKDGMNYKGYNIAVHELGHNVEQVFSLYDVDHTLLQGVPNNAFTEALAFVFQARDMELLGLAKPDAESERLRVLNTFWQTWEIAGVALVDTAVWHWMYDHPGATPAELRDATIKISKDIWNKYYAPVLGSPDTVILGIYSHMIAYPMYLPDYPLGHLIAFQIEEHVKKGGKLGDEFERMARYGAVTPDLWMEHATGAPVGAGPLLRATREALDGMKK
ncbi:hypothetical protein L6R52_19100 [Myxococcota bacterium]|nr:hypothetical protein [Myxococcota bacterium]